MYKLSILLLLLISLYQVVGQNSNIKNRLSPACTLVEKKIFCYGGYTKYTIQQQGGTYTDPVSELVSIDLAPFNNFTSFNKSLVQWHTVTNYQGTDLLEPLSGATSATILSDQSMVIWGGSPEQEGPNLKHPFLNYNPQTNSFKELLLPNGNNYTAQTKIVNIGNDQIWTWGGSFNNSRGVEVSNVVNIFDYKTNKWINQGFFSGSVRTDFSATLISNGMIYLIGGTFRLPNSTSFNYVEGNSIFTYNTTSLGWGMIQALGDKPSNRVSHTVVETHDQKSLLLYGGRYSVSSGSSTLSDIYYVYNIAQNNFTNVELPAAGGNNNRFGHFATIYSQDKLLLAFGYSDTSSPADQLSVLNVADPYNPVWVSAPTNSPPSDDNGNNGSNGSTGSSGGLSTDKLIPTVIVVVVVVIGGIVGAFFFIRHRKNKKRKQFVLEQEDPRKTFDLQDDTVFSNQHPNFDGGVAADKSENSHSQTTATTFDVGATKPFLDESPKDQFCKPFENQADDHKVVYAKPFDSELEKK